MKVVQSKIILVRYLNVILSIIIISICSHHSSFGFSVTAPSSSCSRTFLKNVHVNAFLPIVTDSSSSRKSSKSSFAQHGRQTCGLGHKMQMKTNPDSYHSSKKQKITKYSPKQLKNSLWNIVSSRRKSKAYMYDKNYPAVQQPPPFKTRVTKIRKSLKFIFFATLPFFQIVHDANQQSAHAVMNIPPSNLSKLKDEARGSSSSSNNEKRMGKPKELIAPDPNDPKYENDKKGFDFDMRIYQRELRMREEAEEQRRQSINNKKREYLPKKPQTQEMLEAKSQALQMLQQSKLDAAAEGLGKSEESLSSSLSSSTTEAAGEAATASAKTTTSFSPPKVRVSSAPKTKGQRKILTAKQRAKQITVTTLRYGSFITAGVIFAKAQTQAEQKRVQKGIEIFESQKAEYFNVTGKAESDETLADELKKMKGNTTDTGEDDDDDDDDDDSDEDDDNFPVSRKKPTGNGGGNGGEGGGGVPGGTRPSPPKSSPPVRDAKASDDDIERMKRLFDK